MKLREDKFIVICGPSIEDYWGKLSENFFRILRPVILTKLCVLLLLIGTDVCLNISFFDSLIVRSDQGGS